MDSQFGTLQGITVFRSVELNTLDRSSSLLVTIQQSKINRITKFVCNPQNVFEK